MQNGIFAPLKFQILRGHSATYEWWEILGQGYLHSCCTDRNSRDKVG